MGITLRFKARYLNKILWRVIFIGLIISLIIFLGLKIDITYRYFLSILVIFFEILIAFYLNKNELEQLIIKEEELKLTFFNKVFFRKKPSDHLKQDLNFKLNKDIIELYEKNKLIGKIRRTSLDETNWEKLKSYFELNTSK